MYITFKKSDVLQSIGFALTSATEEYERVKSGVGEALNRELTEGRTVDAEVQEEMSRALTTARRNVEKLDTLRRMAEFSKEDVLLDVESFALLEPNLPGR